MKVSPPEIKSSEITSEHVYLNRREFIKAAGVIGVGAILASCTTPSALSHLTKNANRSSNSKTDELGDPANRYEDITHYNNYYEFTSEKEAVADLARDFVPNTGQGQLPYLLEVTGLVRYPRQFAIEDLQKLFPVEERIYRLRCVETWSMVVPWEGFELSKLLNLVEPLSTAQYVRFETVFDPQHMPGQKLNGLPWPYQEALRLDEALHPLTILATGLYGNPLPNQDGSPLRLVVPWKYGYKGIKSIVRIELVAQKPVTFWNTVAPQEYDFFANVNPFINHPRWSQSTERRIGELARRPTLLLNGYYDQVAPLYPGIEKYQKLVKNDNSSKGSSVLKPPRR